MCGIGSGLDRRQGCGARGVDRVVVGLCVGPMVNEAVGNLYVPFKVDYFLLLEAYCRHLFLFGHRVTSNATVTCMVHNRLK